jgi:phenylacetate-CoA ligase
VIRDNAFSDARIRLLRGRETWAREDFDRFQRERLQRSLAAARRRIPAYSRLTLPADPEDIFEFLRDRVPIISKSELRGEGNDYFPDGGRRRPWTIVGKTSGTTGTPVEVVRSLDSVLWEQAFIRRHWAWAGFSRGMRRATLRGDKIVSLKRQRPPFWLHNRIDNQLVISSPHLKTAFMAAIVEELDAFRPQMLQAYPSTAYSLAAYLDRHGGTLRIPHVFTGSEMLYPVQRQLIEARIGRVVDFYGMAERVAFASECMAGNLHVNLDYSFVEILDAAGEPTSDHGSVVGTTFHNLEMPLLRYRLSDSTRWKPGQCACGSAYPMIEPIAGKYEDVIYSSDGSPLSPSVITFAFKGLKGIVKSQVVQTAPGVCRIRIVPGSEYSPADGERVIANFRGIVDEGMDVTVELREDIPCDPSGKYRWVINEAAARPGEERAP